MQSTSWADRLELVGDDDRLVRFAGALPLRLLAERTGLRAGLSTAMARRGFDPIYDRGQILIDMAVAQILGGEAISDFQGLRHLTPVIGPVPSTPRVWRALSEAGELQLARVNTAVTGFRRYWWGLLAARPEGFPWLKVAGRELTGITVVDLDASIIFAASEKENAAPTYKGGIGFYPNLATCDNTDDLLAIDPRPGNAPSNCAADNIAPLDLAVSRLPGHYRRQVLVRLDGAGFSHDLLEHIASGGGMRGRAWEFSGRLVVHRHRARRHRGPTHRRMDSRDRPERQPRRRHLHRGPDRPTRPRLLAGEDPRPASHRARRAAAPRYRKRATEREKKLGRRYQLIAINARAGQLAWLDARHRSHVHVENDVKQAKDLGLKRWPSRHWAINVAWTQLVALAANLLACLRHLALPAGELRDAAPKLLRYRLLHLPARLTRGQRKRWLHLRAD